MSVKRMKYAITIKIDVSAVSVEVDNVKVDSNVVDSKGVVGIVAIESSVTERVNDCVVEEGSVFFEEDDLAVDCNVACGSVDPEVVKRIGNVVVVVVVFEVVNLAVVLVVLVVFVVAILVVVFVVPTGDWVFDVVVVRVFVVVVSVQEAGLHSHLPTQIGELIFRQLVSPPS